MVGYREILGILDRPHFPKPGAPGLERFKEWFHFNILVPDSSTDLVINFSFAGDVTRAGAGQADVIALVHHRARGWQGGIDSYDASAAVANPERLALSVADAASLSYQKGLYHLALQRHDGSMALQAVLTPLVEPMLLWHDTPLGSGSINWLITPHMEASGELTIGGEQLVFHEAYSYHDHNWGYWKWGEDFGWEWGFFAQMTRAMGEGRFIIVSDRTSTRQGDVSLEHTLAVWRDAKLVKVFTRQMLRSRRHGRFAGTTPRHPGAANLVVTGTVQTVPERFVSSARDEGDWIDFEYVVDAACQISIPNELSFGVIGLNETFGELAVRGVLNGENLEFSARACFEFLG